MELLAFGAISASSLENNVISLSLNSTLKIFKKNPKSLNSLSKQSHYWQ